MKAPVERMIEFLAVAQMPFANQVVGVSHGGKLVGQGGILRLQTPGIARDEGNAETNVGRIPAGQQGSSGGGASWVDIVVVESGREKVTSE